MSFSAIESHASRSGVAPELVAAQKFKASHGTCERCRKAPAVVVASDPATGRREARCRSCSTRAAAPRLSTDAAARRRRAKVMAQRASLIR
jgi:hypothetical protein